MPHCPDKKMPIDDPKMNPEPATKLTDKLAAGTMHGHNPIQARSVKPRTNIGPARIEEA